MLKQLQLGQVTVAEVLAHSGAARAPLRRYQCRLTDGSTQVGADAAGDTCNLYAQH